MNFMEKLERKWGRYAVYELHKYLVGAYCIGFVLNYLPFDITGYLDFDMTLILQGQIWRLITWVFCAQNTGMFTILFLLCLIPMGRTLEHFLGTFRMNVFLIGGVILNLIGGILVYIVTAITLGEGLSVYLTNYHIMLSMFMALAICIPEATVNLYFILPIKMKWMLVVYLLELAYELYVYYSFGSSYGVVYGLLFMFLYGATIIFALLNLFLFFYLSKIRLTKSQRKRQKQFRAQMASEPRTGANITRHKCVICGRTEKDDPNLSFRYCSKCTGNKEYCQDHLFTHTHN